LGVTVEVRRDGPDSTVVLTIREGEPALYKSIDIAGVEIAGDDEVRKLIGVRVGDRYLPDELTRGVERLLEYYDKYGHPFAQVWVDSLRHDADSNAIDIGLTVVEGSRKEISRVRFEGLEHTREDLAVKLSGLKPGEPYNGEKVRESYLRLASSGVFTSVSYPSVRMAPDGSGVEALIKVSEPSQTNSFSGALGYADREADDERVISGLIRLDLVNIGGGLRDFHAFWKNDGQDRSETSLSFRERFLFGRRLGVGVTLEQVALDTVYTWQSAGLETSAPIGRLWGGLLGVNAAVFGDRNTFGEGEVANTVRYRVAGGFSFVEGYEDHGAFIDFGSRYTYAYKEIRKREEGVSDEDVSQYVFEARMRGLVDLTRTVHGSVQVVYRGLESSEAFVPLAEQFYVGGASTIRGYRENQFHGRRTAYLRTELRVGGSRRENGYLFVDGGYVLQESQDSTGVVSQTDEYPVGYGFGLRTASPVGNVDISFGIGDKLSLRQTKVHVILNRNF
jgi:outer membrane protein assembly factor BamA